MAFWRRRVRVRAPAGFEDVEMKPKTAELFASGTATVTLNPIDTHVGARVRTNERPPAQW
jgi:hypothetical protein